MKRIILAIVAVFVVWSALDFVLHGVLLQSTYEASAELWRPMDEMNMPLMNLVTFVFATCFVLIYRLLIDRKSISRGVQFGLLFGLATGFSMGFGSYGFLPMPVTLAWGWFLGNWAQTTICGLVVGAIVKV